MRAMDAGGTEQQLGERQVEQVLDLAAATVVARRGGRGGKVAGFTDGGPGGFLTDSTRPTRQSGKHVEACPPNPPSGCSSPTAAPAPPPVARALPGLTNGTAASGKRAVD